MTPENEDNVNYNDVLFKESIQFAETIASRYYKYYSHIFQVEAIELDDLLQDARVATMIVYKKWLKDPQKFNLKGGVSIAVGFGAMNKKKKAIIERHLFSHLTEEVKKATVNSLSQITSEDRDLIISDFLKAHPSPKTEEKVLSRLYDFEEQREMSYKNLFERLYDDGTVKTKEIDYAVLMEDFKRCTSQIRKRKIVNKVFKYMIEEGWTLERTGQKLDVSKQRVWEVFQIIKKTINSRVDIKQYSKYN